MRQRNADRSTTASEFFHILRGVLQGEVFSSVTFIFGLWLILKHHDLPDSGITVGQAPYLVCISSLEYADDAGLVIDAP